MTITPRTLIIIPGSYELTTSNTAAWARCEWHLRSPALVSQQMSDHLMAALRLSRSDFALLTAMTNVISTDALLGVGAGASILLESLACAITAAVFNATSTNITLSAAQSAIFQKAMKIIDDRHSDGTFTISTLASQMPISKYYLHRIFAATGTTPGQVLESRRVAAATTLLALAPRQSQEEMTATARRSGFNTVRTMHDAIRRQHS